MAISPTFELLVDLVGISGLDIFTQGVSVKVELEAPSLRVVGQAPSTETLYPTILERNADVNGQARVQLLPSAVVGGPYIVSVGAYSRRVEMPDHDARLSELPDATL